MKTQNHNLIHQFNNEVIGVKLPVFLVTSLIILLVGGLFGYGIAQFKKTTPSSINNPSMKIDTAKASGISDKKTFKDQAEGILKEGGIDGEGNFHLERPGGISQNVYLTSSAVDLSKYIGKKVRVHGETFNGQKTGWLMDVGLVEVL